MNPYPEKQVAISSRLLLWVVTKSRDAVAPNVPYNEDPVVMLRAAHEVQTKVLRQIHEYLDAHLTNKPDKPFT